MLLSVSKVRRRLRSNTIFSALNAVTSTQHPISVRRYASRSAVHQLAGHHCLRGHASHFDGASGADAIVGRKHDPKAVDRVTHMIGEIVLAVNSVQQEALLSHAHLVMAGLIGNLKFFVRFGERLIREQPRVMHADRPRSRMRVDVGRYRGSRPRNQHVSRVLDDDCAHRP
jgi:hypothetical protein